MTEQGKIVCVEAPSSRAVAVVDLDHASAVAVGRGLGVQMFIRFVVGADGEHHRYLTGLITEARLLRDRGGLDPHQVSWLEETYEWFNANLPCPPFSSSNWPKDVVSWFRDDAVSRSSECGRSPTFCGSTASRCACFGRQARARSSMRTPTRLW
jgi:hypothetical protein